jgi:transposase
MFLRIVKAAGGKGVQHEYVRLVEAYRENGKSKQRIVCNLGRKDILGAHLNSLIRLLGGESAMEPSLGVPEVQPLGAWDWGPVLMARRLWCELGLDETLQKLGRPGQSEVMAERAFVLVANRLCAPTSEHGLARWLETDFVCDEQGRRWVPEWREEQERRASRLPRVRVELRQLKRWYRTLDQLQARKKEIERELYLRLRDLFSLKVDLVFYDLTSTYFEGEGPVPFAAHGYSRDGKPRNRQVLVGVVMVDGFPIAQHVFAGNWRDAKTVPQVIEDLEDRFGLRRVVFVGDRGMVTADNIERLRSKPGESQGGGHGYVVGLQRRRREQVYRYIERTTGAWQECPLGITAQGKTPPPRTRVQEVASEQPGVRVFVVESEERLAYERTQREKAMGRVRARLEALERRVQQGRLKTAEKIGAAAGRILNRDHGHRYYDWEYRDGVFRFIEHPVHLKRERAYEGKYVIQTEEKDLSAVEVVSIYKQLSEVERAFANLKDVIDLRPIYHQTTQRVEAHLFVAALAFLLHRTLEKKLKAAGLDLSATEALQLLRSVRVVDLQIDSRKRKRSVTRGSSRAALILSALGVNELDPPTPPKVGATVM